MKKLFLSIALAVLPLSIFAQSTPPLILWTYQCTAPKFDSLGNLTAVPIQGFFGYYTTNVVTGAQVLNQCGEADFDLIALGSTTVTAAGVTVTYAQLAALGVAACQAQWAAQHPVSAPAPAKPK